jgi:NADH-quinone oxidoreductase subunit J
MVIVFHISAAIALISTALAISRRSAVHALLNLIVSLLAVALVFFTLGAPFVAALEVIIYAGAIMVVFVFVIMLLNAGEDIELRRASPNEWILPCIATSILLVELICLLAGSHSASSATIGIAPKEIGMALYGPYFLGVELASMLLLSGLIGACQLGRCAPDKTQTARTRKSEIT